jgi:DNA-3-methyladenine glycosylase
MLDQKFYETGSVELAAKLLGCELVHQTAEGVCSGVIVETEAYRWDDAASHSFRGQTARNAVMFGPAGHAYIYFTYGMHYCFNVVAGKTGEAEGVLIRALEPKRGVGLMQDRRNTANLHNLCSGPAKLVQAMGLQKSQNGASLFESELYIRPGQKVPVAVSPRIGITREVDKPWRFFVPDSPFVSKHRYNLYNAG